MHQPVTAIFQLVCREVIIGAKATARVLPRLSRRGVGLEHHAHHGLERLLAGSHQYIRPVEQLSQRQYLHST